MARISLRLLSSCAIGVALLRVEASRDIAAVAGGGDAAAALLPEESWLTRRLVDSLELLWAAGGVLAEDGGDGEEEEEAPSPLALEVVEVEVG